MGYVVAATGPFVVGLLHALSGGWAPSLLLMLALLAAQTVAGLVAGRAG